MNGTAKPRAADAAAQQSVPGARVHRRRPVSANARSPCWSVPRPIEGPADSEFETLEAMVASLGFRPGRDRLFALGDLVDRGPRSAGALAWMETKRIGLSVRGNHEQMLLDRIEAAEIDIDARMPWMTHPWFARDVERASSAQWKARTAGCPSRPPWARAPGQSGWSARAHPGVRGRRDGTPRHRALGPLGGARRGRGLRAHGPRRREPHPSARAGVTFKHGRAGQHDPLGRVHSLGASRGGLAARPELAAGPARHHRDEVRRPIGAHHSETAPTERGCRHMCPARHSVVEQCVHAQPREEGQAAVNTINTLQPPTGGNHEHTANDATPPRVRGGCRFQK